METFLIQKMLPIYSVQVVLSQHKLGCKSTKILRRRYANSR